MSRTFRVNPASRGSRDRHRKKRAAKSKEKGPPSSI
jgi:hypothetical protein